MINDKENRKLAYFFTSGSVGGAERVTLTIAKLLSKDKFDVHIVHICRNIRDLDKFVPENMSQSQIKISNIWDFTTWKIYRLLKKNKPDVVFCSLNYLNVRVIFAAKMASIKKIIVRNNIGWIRWPRFMKTLAKLSYPKASAIILQTKEMKMEFDKVMPSVSKLTCAIPNPLDIDTISTKLKAINNPFDNNEKVNFVYAGRIDRLKGLDVLLKAFNIVRERQPAAYLTIVGAYNITDEYYKDLVKIIKEFQLENYVEFVGFSENPYKYMMNANCFVLPSRSEGNPNVLHEAMYLCTPVVATESIPIISQIVTRDRGLTVGVDDWRKMAEAMITASKMKVSKPYDYTGGNNLFLELFQ